MTSAKQDAAGVQQKHQQTIVDHVEELVASASHIEEALDRQPTEGADDPAGRAAVQNLHDMVKQQRAALVTLEE